MRVVASTFSFICCSYSAVLFSPNRAVLPMPALFTSMFTSSPAACTWPNTSLQPASRHRSCSMLQTATPYCVRSDSAKRGKSSPGSATRMRFSCRRAHSVASAFPKPALAPVIKVYCGLAMSGGR